MKRKDFIDHIDMFALEPLDDDAIKHKAALIDWFDKLHKELAFLRIENTVIYKQLEELKPKNHKYFSSLLMADCLASAIDVQINKGTLNSRSMIADARLNYGDPMEYEYNKLLNDQSKG